jgi:hypothetical protein
MVFTISGLALSIATQFWMILVAVSLVGIGSIFHPEASRVAFRFWREEVWPNPSFSWAVTLEVL